MLTPLTYLPSNQDCHLPVLSCSSVVDTWRNNSLAQHSLLFRKSYQYRCRYESHIFIWPWPLKIADYSRNIHLTQTGLFSAFSLEFEILNLRCTGTWRWITLMAIPYEEGRQTPVPPETHSQPACYSFFICYLLDSLRSVRILSVSFHLHRLARVSSYTCNPKNLHICCLSI